MPTELQLRAAEAWRLMTRVPSILDSITGAEAMPHGAALDYCQDVAPGGDRNEAVTALVQAGADWLQSLITNRGSNEIWGGNLPDADLACGYIRHESFSMASTFLSHIVDRCSRVRMWPTNDNRHLWSSAEVWGQWAIKAQSTIDHCRAVVAAAYPTEAESQS